MMVSDRQTAAPSLWEQAAIPATDPDDSPPPGPSLWGCRTGDWALSLTGCSGYGPRDLPRVQGTEPHDL